MQQKVNDREPPHDVDRRVDKLSLGAAFTGAYAHEILAPDGPRAIRVTETRSDGVSVVFLAKHDDVVSVLKDERVFGLNSYEDRFKEMASPEARLLMVNDSPERRRHWHLVLRAMQMMAPGSAEDPLQKQPIADSRAIAQRAVATLLNSFRARKAPEFDIVSEFGFFAPYLVAREVFGLPGPRRGGFLVMALRIGGWLAGLRHRFTPETAPALNAAYLAQPVLAQLFVNFEGRSLLMRWASWLTMRRLRRHVAKCFEERREPHLDLYRGSLLSCLREVCRANKDDEESCDNAISSVVELFGTAVVVPGRAFASVIEWMTQQPGGIPEMLSRLNRDNAGAFVNEALRLAQPSKFLLRTATESVKFGDVIVRPGDRICLLLEYACRDWMFTNPDSFHPGRSPQCDLPFGLATGPHQCLGRELARATLQEMLLGLKSLPGPTATGGEKQLDGPWPLKDAAMPEVLGFKQLVVTWNRTKQYIRPYGPSRAAKEV